MFLFLRDFQHWNTVWQCVVPFLIVGVLLGGAFYVKNKFTEQPAAAPSEPVVQADPDAWQKMTALSRAEQAVEQQIRIVAQASAISKQADDIRDRIHRTYPGTAPEVKSADDRARQAQTFYSQARQRFDALNGEYQKLGGTHDYRSQIH
jgi:hypothetical protein